MEYILNEQEEQRTKEMIGRPITDLSRLIGAKWFLPLEQLTEKSGVPYSTLVKAVRGEKINPRYEKRLREYLAKL